MSLVLFVLALRHLGRPGPAPISRPPRSWARPWRWLLFREPVTLQLAGAAVLMAIGVYFHLSERHEHGHLHAALDHEHGHVHDAHHRHAHAPGDPPGEPHAHWHHHAPMRHKHPHYPDLHHRHGHAH